MIVNEKEKKTHYHNTYLINWVCMIIIIKVVLVLTKCTLTFSVEISYFNNFIYMYLNIPRLTNIAFL